MKRFNIFVLLFPTLVILFLGGGWWFFTSLAEGDKPTITFQETLHTIGRGKVINVLVEDKKSGLRSLSVTITQDNNDQSIAILTFPDRGLTSRTFSWTMDPVALKLHDGPAMLRFSAVDYSIRKNETLLYKPVTIDVTPPQIYLLTPANNITPGGTCVVAFRTSEATAMSGVMINGVFVPGYPASIDGKQATVTYFGLPLDATRANTAIRIIARDSGGNESSVTLPSRIRNKTFRHDAMNLTEGFLDQKMPDFVSHAPSLGGKTSLEIFTYVNGTMREENEKAIREMSRKTDPQPLWEGTFLRMKDASTMALFGDKRTYRFKKEPAGESIHYGIDLASLAHAPVQAGNSGIVVYTGHMGIYGNTIIVDHGMGVFSLYSHLSVINAKAGQKVAKGDVIGNSGTTGLAGGDHLHFGMIVGGQFVNPLEWWDPHWIKDNITDKLKGK